MSESSVAPPAMIESSAAKPAAYGVFVWYNAGLLKSRFSHLKKHDQTMHEGLLVAMETKAADAMCAASAEKSETALDRSGSRWCAAAAPLALL